MQACGAPPNGTLVVSGISPAAGLPAYALNVWAENDGVSNHIIKNKMWDASKSALLVSELAGLHTELGRRASFLDIGANVGWFTMLAARTGHADVIAVEASEPNAALIERSLCMNQLVKGVTLHRAGLGVRTQTCALVARRSNIASPTVSCKGNAAREMNSWGKHFGFHDYVVVGSMRMVRLDELLPSQPVDVIKIDVEGNELEVAKGWAALFDQRPPMRQPRLVLTEYVPSLIALRSNVSDPLDYLRFFIRRGYTIETDAHARGLPAAALVTERDLVAWSTSKHGRGWMHDLVIRRPPISHSHTTAPPNGSRTRAR